MSEEIQSGDSDSVAPVGSLLEEAVGNQKQVLLCMAKSPTGASTQRQYCKQDIKLSVRMLLNRHHIVFGDYTRTEFEPFLARNVQSVSIVDMEVKVKDP